MRQAGGQAIHRLAARRSRTSSEIFEASWARRKKAEERARAPRQVIASTFASEHELLAAAVREQLRLAVTLAFYAGLTDQDRGQLGAKLAQAFGG